jgi:hypothetical protein
VTIIALSAYGNAKDEDLRSAAKVHSGVTFPYGNSCQHDIVSIRQFVDTGHYFSLCFIYKTILLLPAKDDLIFFGRK